MYFEGILFLCAILYCINLAKLRKSSMDLSGEYIGRYLVILHKKQHKYSNKMYNFGFTQAAVIFLMKKCTFLQAFHMAYIYVCG